MPQDSPRARAADTPLPGETASDPAIIIATAEMGYGHLRPAQSIADALGLSVHRVDAPPLATPTEARSWSRHRRGYEIISRLTQSRLCGRPFKFLLDTITKIEPLHPRRDQSRPTRAVKTRPVARRNLAARICRLDPQGVFRRQWKDEVDHPEEECGRPPLLTLAIGGAGAQVRTVLRLLDGLLQAIQTGRLRVALVAGVHVGVADRFNKWIADAGLARQQGDAMRVLFTPEFGDYYRAFNELLSETDILWTKPSELVFYAALGIPMVLSPPIGFQERYNLRFLLERGAGLEQCDPRFMGPWIEEMLSEGVLAAAAWSAYRHLPRNGTERIVESISGSTTR